MKGARARGRRRREGPSCPSFALSSPAPRLLLLLPPLLLCRLLAGPQRCRPQRAASTPAEAEEQGSSRRASRVCSRAPFAPSPPRPGEGMKEVRRAAAAGAAAGASGTVLCKRQPAARSLRSPRPLLRRRPRATEKREKEVTNSPLPPCCAASSRQKKRAPSPPSSRPRALWPHSSDPCSAAARSRGPCSRSWREGGASALLLLQPLPPLLPLPLLLLLAGRPRTRRGPWTLPCSSRALQRGLPRSEG